MPRPVSPKVLRVARNIAKMEVQMIVRNAVGLKFKKLSDTLVIPGPGRKKTTYTLADLIARRMTKEGPRLLREARAVVARKTKR